jgi:ribosomal protein L22
MSPSSDEPEQDLPDAASAPDEPAPADSDETAAEPVAEAADDSSAHEAPAPKPRRRRRKAAEAPDAEAAEAPAAEAPDAEAGGTDADAADEAEAADEDAPAPAKPSSPAPTRRRSRLDPDLPIPIVRAQAKYVRSSARKARLVCDNFRGKSVDEARAILALTPRAIARDWSKLLESAIANAEHNHELVGEDLYVKAVHADEGPTIKRFRPRAMGRATRIRKRTSHLTILLTPKD